MPSHLQRVVTSKVHNHIPIDHIKDLKIANFFHSFSKRVSNFHLFYEAISTKEDTFKAVTPFLYIL